MYSTGLVHTILVLRYMTADKAVLLLNIRRQLNKRGT
jgi:hypothetical protein